MTWKRSQKRTVPQKHLEPINGRLRGNSSDANGVEQTNFARIIKANRTEYLMVWNFGEHKSLQRQTGRIFEKWKIID